MISLDDMSSLKIIKYSRSELPHIGFRRYLPHPHLRPWVQNYWSAKQDNLPDSGFKETLYPDGGISLTFSFRNVFPSIQLRTRQVTSKVLISESIDWMGIRFHTGGLFKLFSLDMNGLSEADEDPEILRNELDNIQEKLAELDNSNARLLKLETWLLDKCYQKNPSPGLLQYVLQDFLAPNSSLDEIIKNQTISRRQLERKFQQEIGLSPAQLKQLHRIKLARESISFDPSRSLTDIGIECGFYDQSHFIHHFQKITGQTPGQYKSRKIAQQNRE
jgi:AraC-like DNA-binding protein